MRRRRHAERVQPRRRGGRCSAASPGRDRRSPPPSTAARTRGTPARSRGRREMKASGNSSRRIATRALLVLGPDEAVEEARRRPPARRPPAASRAAARTVVLVERRLDLAVVAHALGHLQAQVARHQGRRLVGLDVVEVGPLLAADLQQVAEAVGGDQAGLARRDAGSAHWSRPWCRGRNSDRRGRLIAASGATRRMPSSTPWAMPRDGSSGVDGTFQTSTRPVCLVEQADVGEGSAGIHADAPTRHAVHSAACRAGGWTADSSVVA